MTSISCLRRPELGDNDGICRKAKDATALAKATAAQMNSRLARDITPVKIKQRTGDPLMVNRDEHPRETSTEALANLRPLFDGSSVTAGNASGIKDRAAARRHGLPPIARVLGAQQLASRCLSWGQLKAPHGLRQ